METVQWLVTENWYLNFSSALEIHIQANFELQFLA